MNKEDMMTTIDLKLAETALRAKIIEAADGQRKFREEKKELLFRANELLSRGDARRPGVLQQVGVIHQERIVKRPAVRAMFSRGVVPSALVGSMIVEARDTVAEKVARRKPGQLNIAQLVAELDGCDSNKPVYAAFDGSSVLAPLYGVDSYRGYYEQLAIDPGSQEKLDKAGPTRCIDMAQTLLEALNRTFYGYKGGEFSMFDETPVWVSEYGRASGDMVVGVEEKADMVVIFTKKEEWP